LPDAGKGVIGVAESKIDPAIKPTTHVEGINLSRVHGDTAHRATPLSATCRHQTSEQVAATLISVNREQHATNMRRRRVLGRVKGVLGCSLALR
jgi:hypothetical protein